MIKSILVATDGSPYGDAATRYGIYLARSLEARLAGLHVLDARMLEGPLMADVSGWLGAEPFTAQLVRFRELMEKKGQAVMDAFVARAADAGVPVTTKVLSGMPIRLLLEEHLRAELLILGRQGEHAAWANGGIGSTIERVVRHATKPCLIVPDTFRTIGKILVGYDGSPRASRALHEAIELSLALKAPLVIVTVLEVMDEAVARERVEDAMKIARAHQCVAGEMVVPGTPHEVLRAKARDLQCDLIVLGAFGHNRMREFILGSTTHQVVADSSVPVMLVR